MSLLTYAFLKAIVSGVRMIQPSPASPKPDDVLQIPSRDTNRTIKAHIYKSKDLTSPSPILLNFHGSGFVLPLHGSDDIFCRHIAQKTKYTVLDVQYRLAPENPFPAALNDVEDAIKYVLDHPEEYDASHISLSGFSAGGNLAIAVLSSPTLPANSIHAIIAFYPPMDLSIEPGEKMRPDPSGPDLIPPSGARLFNACYIGKHDRKDPMVSPGLMDRTRLPKDILLITCAHDNLALETENFASNIEKDGGEGRNLICKRIEGVSHAWDKSCKPGSDAEKKRDEAYDMAADILNR